ncbi:MAG: hypothetical protein M9894_26940 [Planctomycetes bacterium]|nr:hypothetical protein [Planctomycetota bacterium]
MSQPGPRRPPDLRLLQAVRDEVKRLRREGLVPVEVRLGQEAWNGVSPEMRFAPFGGRRALLLDGLPCLLVVGREGFEVRTIAPRE